VAGKRYTRQWIKQHQPIKAFYGTSENAVKTQIWIAVSIYVLVAIVVESRNVVTIRRGRDFLILRSTPT
jgi:hypothetical protein